MTLPRWEIPDCWQWVNAGEIARIVGGGTPPSKDEANFSEDGIPWIGPADLTGYREVYICHGRRSLSEQGYARSGATLMPAGAVLFSSRAPIGYCAIAANPISTNQGFKSWVCEKGILPEFVRYYLLASVEYVDSLASGTTFREISGKRVEAIAFPLPPEAEQRRIVAKLDALTARLARARAELDRVPVLAERLRASVLGEVFSPSNLARWRIVRMEDQIAEGLIGLVRSKADQGDIGVPYVRMNHYDLDGRINEDKLTFVDCSKAELARFQLQAGDVLFNTRNSVELVGKVTIWPHDMPGRVYNNNILRLRFGPDIDPRFAFRYMMSPFFRDLMEQEKSATTSVAAIYQRSLYAAPLPVPPKDEQETLVRQIEAAFARADRLEAEAAGARALLDRLESALLAKAFRGELVPQDPNDEPAQALLDRIRAQRAAAPKVRRGRLKSAD